MMNFFKSEKKEVKENIEIKKERITPGSVILDAQLN